MSNVFDLLGRINYVGQMHDRNLLGAGKTCDSAHVVGRYTLETHAILSGAPQY